MVFCPEEGDPAIIKPKLYLDRGRFDAVSGQAFLIEGRGESLRVTSKAGWENEIPLLTDLLRAREGLPLR